MIRSWIAAALAVLFLPGQSSPEGGPLIEWQRTNGPYGGETRGLLFHQKQLLVPADGGLWRSLDGGRSWLALGGRFEQGWGIVQFGTDLLMSDSNGIHRTADLGRSWSECAAIPRTNRTDRILVPAGERLYHWNPDSGLLQSLDRCATWTRVAVPWEGDPGLVAFVFSSATKSFFALTNRGWFRTKDGGANWETISKPKPYLTVLTSASAGGSGLILGTTRGLYRSSDDGISWTHLGFAEKWVSRILVSGPGEIYAAVSDRTLMRSADGGSTWTEAGHGLSGQTINGLAEDDAGTLYAADDTGVYRLEARKWLHVGLPTFFVFSMLAAPWGDVYASAGSLGLYRTSNKGRDWLPQPVPDNLAEAMTLTKNGDLLVGAGDWVYRSRDRGKTWEQVGLQQRVSTLFTVPSTGVILAGTEDGLFRSTDDGETWTERSIGLHHFAVSALGAGADGLLYAATMDIEGDGADAEVYWSRNGGNLWRLFAPPLEGEVVIRLAVLPGGDVLAATERGVFRWMPADGKWEKWEQPAASVTSLAVDSAGRLIVATIDNGLFISRDHGHTWTHNLGLPTPRIRAIVVDRDGDLYAATGKGVGDGRVFHPRGPVAIFRGRIVSKQ